MTIRDLINIVPKTLWDDAIYIEPLDSPMVDPDDDMVIILQSVKIDTEKPQRRITLVPREL